MDFGETLRQFLGPNALGTLITAALGVLAGAWLTSRRETKRAVVEELNSISAALALCFSITSKFLGLKHSTSGPSRPGMKLFGKRTTILNVKVK
jgi:uncharacterized protein (TIGR03382 family)